MGELGEFPLQEYEGRIKRLQAFMLEHHLDGLLVMSEHNHRYLSGHRTRRWIFDNCPMGSVYTASDKASLICDKFEEAAVGATSWISDVRSYPAPVTRVDGFVNLVRDALVEAGLAGARIGAELGTMHRLGIPMTDFERLKSSLSGATFVDASPLLWKVRSAKSASELDAMRQAIALTHGALEVIYSSFKSGKTETSVTQEVYAELARAGSEPGGYVIARHLDVPSASGARPFLTGEVLYMDAGGIVRGYVADCCRSVGIGEIGERRREGFRLLWDVQHAVLDRVRAGVPVRAVVQAYQDALRQLEQQHSSLRLGSLPGFAGHGIGMEVCEPPSLVDEEGDVVLETGMTLMVEPSFGWHEDWYISEEPVAVTSGGYELLCPPAPREIRTI